MSKLHREDSHAPRFLRLFHGVVEGIPADGSNPGISRIWLINGHPAKVTVWDTSKGDDFAGIPGEAVPFSKGVWVEIRML
jgi:hypothetical protein